MWTIDPREFEPDPGLERRLIAEYLGRNHRWRTGGYAHNDTVVGVAFDADGGRDYSAEDTAGMAAEAWPGAEVRPLAQASLATYARSWRVPAVVRSLLAHSDAQTSLYGPSEPHALHVALGDGPWRWLQTEPNPGRNPKEFRYVPTFAGANSNALPNGHLAGVAGAWLHRTPWQNGRVADPPSLVLHGGCGSGPLRIEREPAGEFDAAAAVVTVLAEMGIGAMNELVEFVATLVLPETNVRG